MPGVTGIAYVRYQAPDLDRMEAFLLDFGLTRAARTETALYMRGSGEAHHIHVTEHGPEPAGLGIGLRVGTLDDLDRIARATNRPVECSNEPGGGQRIVLTDPNGFRVDILFGDACHERTPVRRPLIFNNGEKNARLGSLQRLARGPSNVTRIEHAVLSGPHFEAAAYFYQKLLGFELSDQIHAGADRDPVVVFLHCGLGSRFTDHHTVALIRRDEAAIDHCAFVALDWDDLMLGHQYLQSKGHLHDWGVGRHILGSEVFDYWRDPFGNKIEHCFDGDMVNNRHQPSFVSADEDILSIWSPPLSATFNQSRSEVIADRDGRAGEI